MVVVYKWNCWRIDGNDRERDENATRTEGKMDVEKDGNEEDWGGNGQRGV